jgi:hypothetical protein
MIIEQETLYHSFASQLYKNQVEHSSMAHTPQPQTCICSYMKLLPNGVTMAR